MLTHDSGPGMHRCRTRGGAILPHPPGSRRVRQQVPSRAQSWDWNPLQWWKMCLGVLQGGL